MRHPITRAGLAACLTGIIALAVGGCGSPGVTISSVPSATATPVPCNPLPASGTPGAQAAATAPAGAETPVYVGGLTRGFTFGADTKPDHQSKWFTETDGTVTVCYPAGQKSGTVYIFVSPDNATPNQRNSRDFSHFRSFHVEMRGAQGNECIHLGVKDATQPDDGTEVKADKCLGRDWQRITLPLSTFTGVRLAKVYIPFEVVFDQTSASTVEFRNLWYSTATGT